MFPLQKLCLNIIVWNFERFYNAFKVSKDKYQQRHFEFLQRRYSAKLAAELYEVKKFEDEYFSLLINEHLDFIDGDWFDETRYRSCMTDIFRRLPNLTRICFRECFDEILKDIATFCPKIVEIDVSDSDVTDKGLKYLCETKNGTVPCPEIRNLFIRNTLVTESVAECLIRNLPLLEMFYYEHLPQLLHSMHEKELRETGKIQPYNLAELNFQDVCLDTYTDVFETCLSVCPKLESLICPIRDNKILNSPINIRLKKLHLVCVLSDVSININKILKLNGSSLTYLKVDYCTMTISLLGEYCPKLEEFSAKDVYFTDADNDDNVKPNFAFLTKCDFKEIDPSYQKPICLLLSSSPKLNCLSFNCCSLSLELKTQILHWGKTLCPKEITFRRLIFDEIKEFLIDLLLNCPSVEELMVMDCSFVDTDSEFEEETFQYLCTTLANKPKFFLFD